MAILTGRQIGNFQVVRLIGEGGFGEVYEAQNPLIQRRVAIKVLRPGLVQDPVLVRRFLNEARAASGIHHPNIIEVSDAGLTAGGEPYIVMEYLDGDPLQRLIGSRGKLDLAVTQEIARQACSALTAAHAAGIVHRDLKPENLFVLPDRKSALGLQVKVLDFGIAKVKDRGERGTMKTQAGLVMGSPAYMSPEQCKDSSDVDHRTDIYSMGVIVYEMLAGIPPFVCDSAADLLVMQMTEMPPPLRSLVPSLPDHVAAAVMRALAKNRDDRFDSIDAFLGALLGSHPVQVQVASDGSRGPSSTRVVPRPTSSRHVTTLADATGESRAVDDMDEVPRPRRRMRTLAIATTAAMVALVLGGVLLRRPPQTASPTPARVATSSTGAAMKPTAARGRLRVHTSPAGATVIDARDDSIVGQTPLDELVDGSSTARTLTLRLAGYREQTVTVALDADAAAMVTLEPLPPAPLKPEPTAARDQQNPRPRRLPKRIADEDWVAH